MRTPARLLLGLALSVLLVATACKKTSDEDLIKATVRRALAAANEKDAGGVVEDADESFVGPRKMKLADTRRYLMGFFFRKGWVKAIERNLVVEVKNDTFAKAKLEVAVAEGNDVQEVQDLVPTNATMLEIEMGLEKIDGDWKFVKADYRRIGLK